MVAVLLDLLGLVALMGAGYLLAGPWLALLVLGAAALVASRKATTA